MNSRAAFHLGRALFLTLALSLVASACGPASEQAVETPASADVVPIRNAVLFDETVLIGGQPTQEELKQAAEAGYRTVINLRPEGEFTDWDEQAAVEELGLEYVSIPVAGAEGLTRENAGRLRAELSRAGGRPLLVHCASGNRVGALLALSAYHFDEETPDEALAIGLANGLTSLEARVSEYLREQASH